MSQLLKSSLASGLLLVVLLSGCGPATIQSPSKVTDVTSASSSSAAEINKALATITMNAYLPSTDYRIGPEDLLQITLFNVTEAESRATPRTISVRVSQLGLISLPLLGDLKVAGLTSSGVEQELKKQYDRFIHNPQVGVLVVEYRQRVSVIGAVSKPGVLELTGPKTMIDILAMAGGVTDKAGTQVHIYRQGPSGRESHIIDLLVLASNASFINANNAGLITMPVVSGDVINVPPAGMFFVDGAVRAPASYPLGRHYSLTQALATAGGVDRDVSSSVITIFRRNRGSDVETISADLSEILAGSAIDPQIEADDVIVVPTSAIKYAYHRVFGTLLSWGTTILGVAAMTGS